ncbi:DNA-binding protein HU 2 [Seminavis robusta]|uniref:DNA-binding protein HU 2 n=1 Tax=Seminavis robusta TaxID=568900 RepID=A0A9N8E0P0_9STRA|nr:DNA-binding protein HU 2 [Seminavis robusta]|eukprot:Sro503_g155770.1 DNA-binding protein HU 2 (125) ;mRNA; r:19772-20231
MLSTTRGSAARSLCQHWASQKQCRWMSLEDKSNLNLGDLCENIAEEHNLTKAQSRRIVTSLFDSITQAVADKKKVSISNFGSFESVHAKSREMRNIQTGEKYITAAKERVKFKPYTHFKDEVNK